MTVHTFRRPLPGRRFAILDLDYVQQGAATSSCCSSASRRSACCCRRDVMIVHGTFLLLNVICTGATLLAGLPSYGMGFAVAATLTFAVAFFLVRRALLRLLYLAFVRQNEAVAAQKELPLPPDRRFATSLGPSPDA